MNKYTTDKALASAYSATIVTFCQLIDLCRVSDAEPLMHTKRKENVVMMSDKYPLTSLSNHIGDLVGLLNIAKKGAEEGKYIPSLLSIYMVPMMTIIMTTLSSGMLVYKLVNKLEGDEKDVFTGYLALLHNEELSIIAQNSIQDPSLTNICLATDRISEDALYICDRISDVELLKEGSQIVH